jgi:cell wall-associated NlpC family hydrolase
MRLDLRRRNEAPSRVTAEAPRCERGRTRCMPALEPGDLLVFGEGPENVTHIGIHSGNGQIVDAPHPGADVRVEPTSTASGAAFGTSIVVGVMAVKK